MSDQTAYFACMGCGEDRSYPADMMGVTKDGDLWCWDCPGEMFHEDDPEKPVLEKFVPEWEVRIDRLLQELEATRIIGDEKQRRIAELEKELKWLQSQHVRVCSNENKLRKRAQAVVDSDADARRQQATHWKNPVIDVLAQHLDGGDQVTAGNIFTRDADKRIAELEAESAELRKLAQAAVDSNIPGQLKETYAALDALAQHLEVTK